MLKFLVKQIVKVLKIERCSIFKISQNLEKAYLISGEPSDGHGLGMSFSFDELKAIKEVVEKWIKTKKEEDLIKISITNSGGCISGEILQEIFNPFFTTKPDGTGLGLAIAAKIVRDYGGEIKVENDETLKLTTFVVKIPISSQRRRNDVLREMGYHD